MQDAAKQLYTVPIVNATGTYSCMLTKNEDKYEVKKINIIDSSPTSGKSLNND